MRTLGSLIKARRNERGLSQQALADLCGTSDSEIAKIERGERKSPNCQILCRMAKALGYHPLELLKASGFLTNADIQDSLAIRHSSIFSLIVKTVETWNRKTWSG